MVVYLEKFAVLYVAVAQSVSTGGLMRKIEIDIERERESDRGWFVVN